MHWYRIVAQISLILSILNLVLAAPIVVQRTHEARRDKIVLAADVPKKWRKLEAVDLSPRVIPDAMASTGAMASPDAIASPGAMASPEHGSSSEESIGSGYHTPPSSLSPHSPGSASGYLRLFPDLGQYEPPHLNPQPGSPEVPSSPPPEELTPLSQHHSTLRLPADIQLSPLLIPTHLHPPFLPLPPLPAPPHPHPPAPYPLHLPPPPPPAHPSSSGPTEIPQSPQHMESDSESTETYSPPHRFMPLHHFSASDGSMPTLEPISGGPVPLHNPTPESAPSHHSTSDGSPPSPSPPPETAPDNAGFFNKNVMKKVGIVAGTVIVGGALAAGILGSHNKHHKHRDFQDS